MTEQTRVVAPASPSPTASGAAPGSAHGTAAAPPHPRPHPGGQPVADPSPGAGARPEAAASGGAAEGAASAATADWAPSPRVNLAVGLVRTARPRQWMKNLLVLAAPAAAGQLLAPGVPSRLAAVFALFTCASAAVYLFNDARDADADRAHPVKRHRPVANGSVPVAAAYAASVLLAAVALGGATLLADPKTAIVVSVYLGLQLAYCVRLKHLLVADLAVVAGGFLLRALAGGPATGVPISRWFLITAGFGALFMVSAKRYSELVLMEGGGRSRALLAEYTSGYLRFVWQLAAGATVLAYCLWALSEPAAEVGRMFLPWRQLSIVPFLLAVLRYALFADRGTAGAPEDVVLGDRPLQWMAGAWLLCYAFAVASL